jgi:hypothetical protein
MLANSFIEEEILDRRVCIADFSWLYAKVIKEKMKCAGYCCHPQSNGFRFGIAVRITI